MDAIHLLVSCLDPNLNAAAVAVELTDLQGINNYKNDEIKYNELVFRN